MFNAPCRSYAKGIMCMRHGIGYIAAFPWPISPSITSCLRYNVPRYFPDCIFYNFLPIGSCIIDTTILKLLVQIILKINSSEWMLSYNASCMDAVSLNVFIYLSKMSYALVSCTVKSKWISNIYIYTHTHTHAQTYIYTHIQTHIHIHTHLYILAPV